MCKSLFVIIHKRFTAHSILKSKIFWSKQLPNVNVALRRCHTYNAIAPLASGSASPPCLKNSFSARRLESAVWLFLENSNSNWQL